ncbi:septum formation inhibitor-activating ATPase [Alkalicaulis satelles]|uniref:Septum formation inhibitor-activating ATPase n=1 Tax=Alkalicaulis satelles TaxID=2609175 RepID=A0A5M6ZGY3_9PROT|nr:septum formation inhibitor-activating ATPase [Alkalicaulis satelles]KAA5803570.1 septum formation inhibitor-activating ATPase [Alkalicaulis satelles]
MSRDELIEAASATDLPFVVEEPPVRAGGVDPLGLRQINFQLMDQVFPGLNNTARHIRPYIVVTWAWRQAAEIARKSGARTISVDLLKDFISRIEVIFAWSQFLANPETDLPGRDVLAHLLNSDSFCFAGAGWDRLRDSRTYSTALTAPINYGPSLKGLRWVVANPENTSILLPVDQENGYLADFEDALRPALEHPALSTFGPVAVAADDVRQWSKLWPMASLSTAEQQAARTRVFGEMASPPRRAAFELMKAAYQRSTSKNISEIRTMMADPGIWTSLSVDGQSAGRAWAEVQVRQLFRLAIEGLFYWMTRWIDGKPIDTSGVAEKFVRLTESRTSRASDWISGFAFPSTGVVTCLEQLDEALSGELDAMPQAILAGLATAISQAPDEAHSFESADRLPLSLAARQARAWSGQAPRVIMTRLMSDWVLAQHTYWAIGRGLADARSQGKSILRLKLVLEDGNWTNVPGTFQPRPNPTPDRLETALSLAMETAALE